MKKIFALLMIFLTVQIATGCTAGSSDDGGETRIIMLKVHENYAWGRHQDITVIDSGGRCYSSGSHSNDGEKDENWVEFPRNKEEDSVDNGWYERILDIVEAEEPDGKISAEKLSLIRENARSFAEWSDLPEKEYGDYMADYGKVILYGVYFDGDGEPRLAELAAAGDSPYCKGGARVRKFVNRLKLLDYKFA